MNLTPTGFAVIVAALLVLAIIVTVAEKVRVNREATPEPEPPFVYTDLCAIEFCNRYAAMQLPGSRGTLLVCRHHAGWVSEWTGPAVFDQAEESA